jgi:RHS repeat-associated protein
VWADHLGTPRVVSDAANGVRWEWANAHPFGAHAPNDNPSGAGAFAFNLRFPGQYFDAETGLHYNYFRDYDPGIGRYVQSDPIGLDGGINTYAYAYDAPLTHSDPEGLQAAINAPPFYPRPNFPGKPQYPNPGMQPNPREPWPGFSGQPIDELPDPRWESCFNLLLGCPPPRIPQRRKPICWMECDPPSRCVPNTWREKALPVSGRPGCYRVCTDSAGATSAPLSGR